tara:strand:+ start:30999 stop:32810 length:1812 start_codon:yes stop_codon:yes gene_type:complete
MCGFLVEFRKKDIPFNLNKFKKAGNLISHRGPDDESFVNIKNISMQFFRLSIRDLSKNGSQPMWDYNKKYLIVFNGEIYNTDYLKKLINTRNFYGYSDTEILINLYSKFGLKIFKIIEGMFSFVIYDKEKNQCIVGRDRFGIKPLYFFNNEQKIIFSSEIKPILNYKKNSDFSKKAFEDFFLKGYLDHKQNTFFKDVFSLEPSHYLVISPKKFEIKRYWNLKDNKENKKISHNKIKEIKNLINYSVKSHLISDREVGVFMSGGTDSTSISQIVKKNISSQVKTFTYDFENNEKFSELDKAQRISKKLKMSNYSVIIKPSDIIKNMNSLCYKLESPFTSIRLFGTDKLYKLASQKKIKVILEGHGGDEMLGGYNYHIFPYQLDRFNNNLKKIKTLKLKNLDEKLFVIMNQGLATTDGTSYFNKDIFSEDFLRDFKISSYKFSKKKFVEKFNFLKRSQLLDINFIKIPRVLKYTDRLSMNHGVETRVPFLDHNLFHYSFHLKNSEKFKNNQSRYMFKKAFRKEKIRSFFSKNKKSIVDPQTNWLKYQLKEYVYDNLNSSTLKNCEYFNQKNILHYYENFLKNKINTSFLIFNILTTIKFIEAFKK